MTTTPVSRTYPGGLAELDFVEAYARSALKKPEAAADAALGRLVFAEAGDRAILAGLIAMELAEACRRLVAVYRALADRSRPVAERLLEPLPGVVEWNQFVQDAATLSPEQIVRHLYLGDDALEWARLLRSQPDLADLGALVAAAETGNPMLLIPDLARRKVAETIWLGGIDAEARPIASSFGADEASATALADLTADLAGIARGFLLSYVNARRSAGRLPAGE
jgi:hypothetical protein